MFKDLSLFSLQEIVPAAGCPPCDGTNQLGTSPVAGHCESLMMACDVSMSAFHRATKLAPSFALLPHVDEKCTMKSRNAM